MVDRKGQHQRRERQLQKERETMKDNQTFTMEILEDERKGKKEEDPEA